MKPEHAVGKRFAELQASMWAVGTVTAIALPKVTVTVRGASLSLPKLASYSPTVGDVVQIAWPPSRPFVLGKIG